MSTPRARDPAARAAGVRTRTRSSTPRRRSRARTARRPVAAAARRPRPRADGSSTAVAPAAAPPAREGPGSPGPSSSAADPHVAGLAVVPCAPGRTGARARTASSPPARRLPRRQPLGWQWTVGTGTGRPYGFSRWQVQKRRPSSAALRAARRLPIEEWPDASAGPRAQAAPDGPDLRSDPGPRRTAAREAVLTGEPRPSGSPRSRSGTRTPRGGPPALPATFVFDEALLARWRLSASASSSSPRRSAPRAAPRAARPPRGPRRGAGEPTARRHPHARPGLGAPGRGARRRRGAPVAVARPAPRRPDGLLLRLAEGAPCSAG
jgi:hypothetical protein